MSILTRFKELIEENLPKDPERLGLWLESQNPGIARRFLGYASEVLQPYHLGMGIEVRAWGDEGIELYCPFRWVNRNRNGRIHWGVLLSAAELAVQMFWQRHLLSQQDKLVVNNLRTEFSTPVKASVILNYKLSPIDREQILFRARSHSNEPMEFEVPVYNEQNLRLGAIIMNVSLRTTSVLSSGG